MRSKISSIDPWALPPKRLKIVRAGATIDVYESHSYGIEKSDKEIKRKNVERQENSVLRSRRMARWITRCNTGLGTTYFFTATFADDIKDYDEALLRWKKFRRILLSEFPEMSYIAVPEVQPRSKRWHFHSIFFNMPRPVDLIKKYGKRIAQDGRVVDAWLYFFTEMWTQANGGVRTSRADISRAKSVEACCRYLNKYVTKGIGGSVSVGRRNYYAGGKSLRRPVVTKSRHDIPQGLPQFGVKYLARNGWPASFARYSVTC